MWVFLTDAGNMPIVVQKEGEVLLGQADAGVVKPRPALGALGPHLGRSLLGATQWEVMKQHSKDKQHYHRSLQT